MASPFLIYFADIGTVVAALGAGFSGGWVLSSSEPVKGSPRDQAGDRGKAGAAEAGIAEASGTEARDAAALLHAGDGAHAAGERRAARRAGGAIPIRRDPTGRDPTGPTLRDARFACSSA